MEGDLQGFEAEVYLVIRVQTGKEKEKACGRKRKAASDHQNHRNCLPCSGEQGKVWHAELQRKSNT